MNDKYVMRGYTMRSLKQYIAESVKSYHYRIKIAGDVSETLMQLIEINLQKFNPIKIGEPKSTPIQKSPYGFPNLSNERITIIDVEFRYPVIEPFVKQMAQLLGLDPNRLRMIDADYDDSITGEAEQYANQMKESPLLTKEEMGSADGSEEANKAYSGSYLASVKDQMKDSEIEIPYAGKKTAAAFDPFKAIPQDKKGAASPMSKMTRVAKPATGAKFNK